MIHTFLYISIHVYDNLQHNSYLEDIGCCSNRFIFIKSYSSSEYIYILVHTPLRWHTDSLAINDYNNSIIT